MFNTRKYLLLVLVLKLTFVFGFRVGASQMDLYEQNTDDCTNFLENFLYDDKEYNENCNKMIYNPSRATRSANLAYSNFLKYKKAREEMEKKARQEMEEQKLKNVKPRIQGENASKFENENKFKEKYTVKATLINFKGQDQDSDLQFLYDKIFEFIFFLNGKKLFRNNGRSLLEGYYKHKYEELKNLDFNVLIFIDKENILFNLIKGITDNLKKGIFSLQDDMPIYAEMISGYSFKDIKDQVEFILKEKNFLNLNENQKRNCLEKLKNISFREFKNYCSTINVKFKEISYIWETGPERKICPFPANLSEDAERLQAVKLNLKQDHNFYDKKIFMPFEDRCLYTYLFRDVFYMANKDFFCYRGDVLRSDNGFSLEQIPSIVNFDDQFRIKKEKDLFIKELIKAKNTAVSRVVEWYNKNDNDILTYLKSELIKNLGNVANSSNIIDKIKGISLKDFKDFVVNLKFDFYEDGVVNLQSDDIRNYWNSCVEFKGFTDENKGKNSQDKYGINNSKYNKVVTKNVNFGDILNPSVKCNSLVIELSYVEDAYNYLFKYIFFKRNSELFSKYIGSLASAFNENKFKSFLDSFLQIYSDILIFKVLDRTKLKSLEGFLENNANFDWDIKKIKIEILNAVKATIDYISKLVSAKDKDDKKNPTLEFYRTGCIEYLEKYSNLNDAKKYALIKRLKEIDFNDFIKAQQEVKCRINNFKYSNDLVEIYPSDEKSFLASFEEKFDIYYLFFIFMLYDKFKDKVYKLTELLDKSNNVDFFFRSCEGIGDFDKKQKYTLSWPSLRETNVYNFNGYENKVNYDNILKDIFSSLLDKFKKWVNKTLVDDSEEFNELFYKGKDKFKGYLQKNWNLFEGGEDFNNLVDKINNLKIDDFLSFIEKSDIINKFEISDFDYIGDLKDFSFTILIGKYIYILKKNVELFSKNFNLQLSNYLNYKNKNFIKPIYEKDIENIFSSNAICSFEKDYIDRANKEFNFNIMLDLKKDVFEKFDNETKEQMFKIIKQTVKKVFEESFEMFVDFFSVMQKEEFGHSKRKNKNFIQFLQGVHDEFDSAKLIFKNKKLLHDTIDCEFKFLKDKAIKEISEKKGKIHDMVEDFKIEDIYIDCFLKIKNFLQSVTYNIFCKDENKAIFKDTINF